MIFAAIPACVEVALATFAVVLSKEVFKWLTVT